MRLKCENFKNRGEKSPLFMYLMYDLSIFFVESERIVFKNYTKFGTVARERAVLGLIGGPRSVTVPILYNC